jgi:predicted nucleic acid-binding protein
MNEGINHVITSFRFVIDTTTLISYFHEIFGKGSQISVKGLSLVEKVFKGEDNYLMVIPSTVFVEIFDKWFRNYDSRSEELRAEIIAKIYKPIKNNPNIQIRELDQEVLENFLHIHDPLINLENRDRIILASAITLNSALITSDGKIKRYYQKYRPIPQLIT